jgi:riboflavin biosynthesis pyrimidine reductase
VRQLLPLPGPVDPVAAHAACDRPAPEGRPWVLVNMVASVDGATAIDGRSGGLGGAGDRAVFRAIRGIADVILVAAGTVRAESYGPPRTAPGVRAQRIARGQQPHPRLAIVSRSLDLDPTAALFQEASEAPLIFTTADAPGDRRGALAAVAEVQEAGETSVDLARALAALWRHGARTVLAEGGPRLNGQLLGLGLVDEVDLTTAAILAGGDAARFAVGAPPVGTHVELAHLWEQDGDLFARYVRSDP